MARVTDPIAARLAGLRQEMARRKVQAMLITSPIDVGYLSGFTGDDSWLLVGAGRPWLITDFRYIEQAEKECPRVGRVLRQGLDGRGPEGPGARGGGSRRWGSTPTR